MARPPKVRWSTKRSSGPPSVKAARTRRWVSSGGTDQELSAHAQVRDQRVGGVEREPQVLAASAGPQHRPAGEPGGKVDASCRVPPNRARVQDRDPVDRAPDDPPLQAPADDLDLGQLGHYVSPATAPAPRATISRQELSAARCSASFLDRPVP